MKELHKYIFIFQYFVWEHARRCIMRFLLQSYGSSVCTVDWSRTSDGERLFFVAVQWVWVAGTNTTICTATNKYHIIISHNKLKPAKNYLPDKQCCRAENQSNCANHFVREYKWTSDEGCTEKNNAPTHIVWLCANSTRHRAALKCCWTEKIWTQLDTERANWSSRSKNRLNQSSLGFWYDIELFVSTFEKRPLSSLTTVNEMFETNYWLRQSCVSEISWIFLWIVKDPRRSESFWYVMLNMCGTCFKSGSSSRIICHELIFISDRYLNLLVGSSPPPLAPSAAILSCLGKDFRGGCWQTTRNQDRRSWHPHPHPHPPPQTGGTTQVF